MSIPCGNPEISNENSEVSIGKSRNVHTEIPKCPHGNPEMSIWISRNLQGTPQTRIRLGQYKHASGIKTLKKIERGTSSFSKLYGKAFPLALQQYDTRNLEYGTGENTQKHKMWFPTRKRQSRCSHAWLNFVRSRLRQAVE